METRLNGNTCKNLIAIVGDRERSYASVIPAIRRSSAIIWKLSFTPTTTVAKRGKTDGHVLPYQLQTINTTQRVTA